ncbi:MAG: hypothetical protein KKG75_02585 [Nanoarchaeota archaeon]|nr:hypothetical protein [Nanoarchaeota archaeon]
MDVLEDLKDFEPDLNESKLTKTLIFIIAMFMLIIFLVYMFNDALDLHSIIKSNKVKENEIDFTVNKKLIFQNSTLEILKATYLENQKTEFKACLIADKIEDIYYINDIYFPKIYSQSFNQVVSEPCPKFAIIDLHSHPFKQCIASQQDFKTFNNFKESNPEALMVIMCTESRFSVYN